MKTVRVVTVLLCATLACAGASAATLNFQSLASGDLQTTNVDLPEVRISVSAPPAYSDQTPTLFSNEFFNAVGEGGSICGVVRTPGLSCIGDLHIDFKGTVKNLAFEVNGYDPGNDDDPGDSGEVFALGAAGAGQVLSSRLFTDQSEIDFGTLSGIRGLQFHNTGTGSGYAFGKFSFDISPLPVPEPQSWLLMALGLAVIGGMARHRQAR